MVDTPVSWCAASIYSECIYDGIYELCVSILFMISGCTLDFAMMRLGDGSVETLSVLLWCMPIKSDFGSIRVFHISWFPYIPDHIKCNPLQNNACFDGQYEGRGTACSKETNDNVSGFRGNATTVVQFSLTRALTSLLLARSCCDHKLKNKGEGEGAG